MKKTVMPERLLGRVKCLQGRVRALGVDAVVVVNAVDTRYLTGFVGDDSWTVVPARGKAVTVLSDSRFEEQIAREAPHVTTVMRKKKLSEELKTLITKKGWKAVGVQKDYVTVGQFEAAAAVVGKRKLKAIDDGLIGQRAVKTADEVRAIKKAGQIQQEAFLEMREFVEPGMTENEVCAFLEYRMRALGADGVSFHSIVAADANAALPHAIPGRRKLKKNGIVLIDWGAKYDGYCSDMTRVIGLGGMSKKMQEVYEVVLAAQLAGIAAVGPGVSVKEVDKAARDVIVEAGYGERFGHGLGHGIGLDIHEEPRVSGLGEGALASGMVVTIEPGVYLPGVGGVRIEDDVLVTDNGHRLLTNLPKSLESAII